jgi:hypothetical protein
MKNIIYLYGAKFSNDNGIRRVYGGENIDRPTTLSDYIHLTNDFETVIQKSNLDNFPSKFSKIFTPKNRKKCDCFD